MNEEQGLNIKICNCVLEGWEVLLFAFFGNILYIVMRKKFFVSGCSVLYLIVSFSYEDY